MAGDWKILILEDDPYDAELVQRVLQKAGISFNAKVVSEEKEYIQAISNEKYDVILSDNALPQYNSIEALRLIKSVHPHIAFILVTGTVSEEFAVNVMLQGADDYVLKTNLTRLPSAVINAIDKKRIQSEVETERNLSTEIINSLPGLFFMYNCSGYMARWNSNLESVTGLLPSEVTHKRPSELFQQVGQPRNYAWEPDLLISGQLEVETILHTRTGQQLPYLLTATTVHYGSSHCLLGTGLDLSLSKQSQRELLQLNEQLRSLSQRLQNAREEEQRRIARELHDELGQQITGLKMDIFSLKSSIESGRPTEFLQQKIGQIGGLLDESVAAIRKISSELHPSILENLGLAAALEWQAGEFSKRFGIPVDFAADPLTAGLEIDLFRATGVFRIFQESLTNVARHAGPCRVNATLSLYEGKLLLQVADTGTGFHVGDPGKRKTLGLLGMRERAIMIGAEIKIESKAGEGTELSIVLPL